MSSLGNILEREIQLISRFLVLLEDEQIALKTANPETLPEIHSDKAALVDELNALEAGRNQLVGGGSPLSDRERMHAWLKSHPGEKKIATQWQALIDLAHQAKLASELNASLVKLHLERTTQALVILTRHSQGNQLYGSNGQAMSFTGSRIVDSA
jgi:flagella synthesis protein FlgN